MRDFLLRNRKRIAVFFILAGLFSPAMWLGVMWVAGADAELGVNDLRTFVLVGWGALAASGAFLGMLINMGWDRHARAETQLDRALHETEATMNALSERAKLLKEEMQEARDLVEEVKHDRDRVAKTAAIKVSEAARAADARIEAAEEKIYEAAHTAELKVAEAGRLSEIKILDAAMVAEEKVQAALALADVRVDAVVAKQKSEHDRFTRKIADMKRRFDTIIEEIRQASSVETIHGIVDKYLAEINEANGN